jgi:hypothetical protein
MDGEIKLTPKSDNLRNFVKHFAHKKLFTKLYKTLNKMYVPDGSKLSSGSISKQSIKPEVAGRQAGRHEFLYLSLEKKMKKLCMQIAYIYSWKETTKQCQAPASNKR